MLLIVDTHIILHMHLLTNDITRFCFFFRISFDQEITLSEDVLQ